MCEHCEDIQEQDEQYQEEFCDDLLENQGVTADFALPSFEIPMEFYDSEKFFKGIDDASYMAGFITALANTGIPSIEVLAYLIQKDTIEMNLKMAEINKEANIAVSKNTVLVQEKNQI